MRDYIDSKLKEELLETLHNLNKISSQLSKNLISQCSVSLNKKIQSQKINRKTSKITTNNK